jgi:hypothetical protein
LGHEYLQILRRSAIELTPLMAGLEALDVGERGPEILETMYQRPLTSTVVV